jgi:hypothetical protein
VSVKIILISEKGKVKIAKIKKMSLNDATSNLKRTDRIEEIRQQCTG